MDMINRNANDNITIKPEEFRKNRKLPNENTLMVSD